MNCFCSPPTDAIEPEVGNSYLFLFPVANDSKEREREKWETERNYGKYPIEMAKSLPRIGNAMQCEVLNGICSR